MGTFQASVQYGDWQGTSAADNADFNTKTVERYLRDKNEITDDDFLLATSIWVGENHNGRIGTVFIQAFILEGRSVYEDVREYLLSLGSEPVPVKEVRLEMNLQNFVTLFKRFSVMLTWRDLPLEGMEYTVTNE